LTCKIREIRVKEREGDDMVVAMQLELGVFIRSEDNDVLIIDERPRRSRIASGQNRGYEVITKRQRDGQDEVSELVMESMGRFIQNFLP
jgi:hypothetical protein